MAISAFAVKVPSAEPFIAMSKALVDVLPDFLPYGGEHQGVVPHLSVAHGNPSEADAAAAELQERLDASGGIQADCSSVVLIENSTGRWEELHVFHLAPVASIRGCQQAFRTSPSE